MYSVMWDYYPIKLLVAYIFGKFMWQKFFETKKVDPENLPITIVSTVYDCESACKKISSELDEIGALGFDIEWIPDNFIPRRVSLLQLASTNGSCYLVRLNHLRCIPDSLRQILGNDAILKVGVECMKDANRLWRDYGVQVSSCLDLRYLYPEETKSGLAALAKKVISVDLQKNFETIFSDWDASTLQPDQIRYAAKDAWAAIEIYKSWRNSNKKICHSIVSRFKDEAFSLKKLKSFYVGSNENEGAYHEGSYIPQSRRYTRKTPLYDNCWMYAPDGELLCSCSRSKANWYVDNNLATVQRREPYSIRLTFEPKRRPQNDKHSEYDRQVKQNICVICGSETLLLKHHVVPREYRKHFPKSMKSHQSHDVVLTCVSCHLKAEVHMKKLKESIATLCDAPTYTPERPELKSYRKIKSICKTLLCSGNTIPKTRREQLEKQLKQFFPELSDITAKALEEISKREEIGKKSINDHGLKVVEYFKINGGLTVLEIIWRTNFLENLKPQFLPSLWC